MQLRWSVCRGKVELEVGKIRVLGLTASFVASFVKRMSDRRLYLCKDCSPLAFELHAFVEAGTVRRHDG